MERIASGGAFSPAYWLGLSIYNFCIILFFIHRRLFFFPFRSSLHHHPARGSAVVSSTPWKFIFSRLCDAASPFLLLGLDVNHHLRFIFLFVAHSFGFVGRQPLAELSHSLSLNIQLLRCITVSASRPIHANPLLSALPTLPNLLRPARQTIRSRSSLQDPLCAQTPDADLRPLPSPLPP
jgi:hypothetical protein